ncbi:hypothetical protein FEDK69T_15930 [Flavobacterium enshiense DK69]|nr:hypothetical protein FEDK69T_15930 [Flavobacterium enshiense DK69]
MSCFTYASIYVYFLAPIVVEILFFFSLKKKRLLHSTSILSGVQ